MHSQLLSSVPGVRWVIVDVRLESMYFGSNSWFSLRAPLLDVK